MRVTLIQATPEPIGLIAKVASVCYDSDPKDAMKMVKHLYRNGHESVFEHVWFTFRVEGISRACSHQLVRHRHCSFTQRSQRYCDEADSGVILPGSISRDLDTAKALNTVYLQYDTLCERGVAKEDARYILPNAASTEMYISMNLRELMHVCEERLCLRAQKEIREVVKAMAGCVDEDLRWMLVPRCGNPRYNCLEKSCKRKKQMTEAEKGAAFR